MGDDASAAAASATSLVSTRPITVSTNSTTADKTVAKKAGVFSIHLALSDGGEEDWRPCRTSISPFLASELILDKSGEGLPTENPPQLYYLLQYMQFSGIKLFFCIPDVVFISDGLVSSHLFTAKSGEILRKSSSSLEIRDIARSFISKTIDGRYNFEKCVALVHDEPAHLLRQDQFEQLEKTLLSNERGSSRTDANLVMQMYIKPKYDIGYECCVVRKGDSLWVHNRTFRYSRRYKSCKVFCHGDDEGLEVFFPVPEAIANENERLSSLMLRYMWKAHATLDVLTCEFVQDYNGKLYLHRMSTSVPEKAMASLGRLPE